MLQREPFHDLTGYPKIPNLRRYLDRCRWPLRKSCIPYEQLVLGAADPLERATAATFVHLLWLELLQQLELGNCLEDLMRPNFGSAALNGVIAQHLRLVGAKQQTDSFLLRLKALQGSFQHGAQGP